MPAVPMPVVPMPVVPMPAVPMPAVPMSAVPMPAVPNGTTRLNFYQRLFDCFTGALTGRILTGALRAAHSPAIRATPHNSITERYISEDGGF